MRRLAFGVVPATVLLWLLPSVAWAQQQQFGQPPNTYVTWGTNNGAHVDVTYFIGAGFNAAETNLIRQAASQWSTSANVTLVEVGTAAAANLRLTEAAIGVGALSQINRPTLAEPGLLNGHPWAQIQSPETITLSSNFTWWDGVGAQPVNAFDFQAVMLDLMGYGLGLGFVTAGSDPTSVMQPQFTAGLPGNHSLSPTDVSSIQDVYGAPEPATLALFGTGLFLVGFSRARRAGVVPGRAGVFDRWLRR